MNRLLIVLLVAFSAWKLFSDPGSVSLGPGVMVDQPPEQDDPFEPEPFQHQAYTITPLASFDIKAKVLARKNYFMGRQADLSPVDLALGWQNMSDESVLADIDISQSNRWYHWRVSDFPIPRREIETQSANMHLIPANDEIESMIDDARPGDIIELSGKLVRVDADDGWNWVSSLSRNDTGNHACELVWVDRFRVVSL